MYQTTRLHCPMTWHFKDFRFYQAEHLFFCITQWIIYTVSVPICFTIQMKEQQAECSQVRGAQDINNTLSMCVCVTKNLS